MLERVVVISFWAMSVSEGVTLMPAPRAVGMALFRHLRLVLLFSAVVFAQEIQTLEQAASRSASNGAVYEGKSVTVRAQIAGAPVWALGTYYVPLRDLTERGL